MGLKLNVRGSDRMGYWINEYVGTMSMVERAPQNVVVVDVRHLVDGYNPPEHIAETLKVIMGYVYSGQPVFIMCAAGISRSNALAAGVLVLAGDFDNYDEALFYVRSVVPRSMPNQGIIDSTREAVKLVQQSG